MPYNSGFYANLWQLMFTSTKKGFVVFLSIINTKFIKIVEITKNAVILHWKRLAKNILIISYFKAYSVPIQNYHFIFLYQNVRILKNAVSFLYVRHTTTERLPRS